jgi:hypothetical protein
MKPTRNIVKENTGLWKPKHTVWYKHNKDFAVYNDDEEIICHGREQERSCKRLMRRAGKKNIGSYEWGGEE